MPRQEKLNTAQAMEAISKSMLKAATLVEKTMREKMTKRGLRWGDTLTITLKFKINKDEN
jgi:hypothetical protein